jgi:glycerol uptake facilitator-like aquaporin
VHPTSLARRLFAEGLGTALLLAAIVGSGIMAERLSGGNVGIALLCNSLATGAILVVLITIFGPESGAHLNPAVTLAFLLRRSITTGAPAAYVSCQIAGPRTSCLGRQSFKSRPQYARNQASGSRRAWRPSD